MTNEQFDKIYDSAYNNAINESCDAIELILTEYFIGFPQRKEIITNIISKYKEMMNNSN